MATYKNKAAAMDKIHDVMNNEAESVSITIGRERMETINPFVLLFYDSLLEIINEFNLSQLEIKALLKILHYMQYGNLVNISYAQIMRDIGADPTHSSRVTKRLKNAGILIDKDGHTFLNPHIVAKGKFKRNNLSDTELLEYAAEEMEKRNLKPSILTRNLKKKMTV